MKLASWRKKKGLTQEQLAAMIGCAQPFISQIERAVDALIPGAEFMIKIYEVSSGEVQPNDFYDLPLPVPERDAA